MQNSHVNSMRTKPLQSLSERDDEPVKLVLTLVYGKVSCLELASLQLSKLFDFELLRTSDNLAVLSASLPTASRLIRRLGGSYKIARIYGGSASDFISQVDLPYADRFNWTVSSYDCDPSLSEELKSEFLNLLKSRSIRKAKYLEPSLVKQSREDSGRVSLQELKLDELHSRILNPSDDTSPGLDLVVAGGIESGPLYGVTVGFSDVAGFERRDFGRSYQNPTMTLSPRAARVLVNLSATEETKTLLDPFCGLGTILQEALVCGYNVVGVDKSRGFVEKARSNLAWLKEEYGLSPKLEVNLLHGDATKLEHQRLPPFEAIATEPILIPTFKENPTSAKSREALGSAAYVYRASLHSLSLIMSSKEGRMTIVTPSIVDDRGDSHPLFLPAHIADTRLKLFKPSLAGLRFDYPLKIESGKKRIVNRNVYVFTAS
jgi:tRNA G10  N-methylase Trm11